MSTQTEKAAVPDACPMCDTLLRASDVDTYIEFGVCTNCDMSFRQPRMKDWNCGWRPSQEQVDNMLKSLRKQPFFYKRNII